MQSTFTLKFLATCSANPPQPHPISKTLSPLFGFTKFINLLYLLICAFSKVSCGELNIPHEYVRVLSRKVEKNSLPKS